jgi:predicted DsbA family dithiol-disulfide isomerase
MQDTGNLENHALPKSMQPIRISHFSDTLCVWAYVSQIRLDELVSRFPGAVEIDTRYVHVFGNVPGKLDAAWKDRGGVRAYGEHVESVVAKFGHVTLHPDIWVRDTPQSSMPSHLFLCALRLLDAGGAGPQLPRAAWAVREAFFRDGADISRQDVLFGIAERLGLPVADIERVLKSGAAHAELSGDIEMARTHGIQASPTLLFNEGRQRLTGNVGYRIIEANVRELLESDPNQLSWC